jgi:hypothetical protein
MEKDPLKSFRIYVATLGSRTTHKENVELLLIKNIKYCHNVKTDMIFWPYRPALIFSYIHFTFPQSSKCFLSNGINNMHILDSGPELQAGRCGYVILDKIEKSCRSFS